MKKHFTHAQQTFWFSLLILFCIGLNSCRKDFITTPLEETSKSKITSNGISLETVNFKTFKQEVDFNKLGKLKTTFESIGNEKSQIRLEGTTNDDFVIILDGVKKLTQNGKASYVFALKQNTLRAVSFRNLTIEQNATKDSLKAFITVYTPDKKWITAQRNNQKIKWIGNLSYLPIDLALVQNLRVESEHKVDSYEICSNINVISEVEVECPEDVPFVVGYARKCTELVQNSYLECYTIDSGIGFGSGGWFSGGSPGTGGTTPPDGGNTGGGGSATTPNPPSDYNPCDSGGEQSTINSINGVQVFVSGETPCDNTLIPPPNTLTAKQFLIQLLQISDLNVIAMLGQAINPNTTVTIADELANYYYSNGGDTLENIDFLNWATNYLTYTSNVSFDTFKNQYLGKSEGQDGDYDAVYWDNPNLTFPKQDLPTWANYYNFYPKTSTGGPLLGEAVYNLVGGYPLELRNAVLNDSDPTNDNDYNNACALRVSRALNYSGVVIPYIPNQTFLGADGKYYFLGARNLNKWMRKTFGTNDGDPNTPLNLNHIHITKSQAGPKGIELVTLLAGVKGIYSMVSDNPVWASGHADLLKDNTACINDCHFDGPIKYIDVWKLN